MADPQQAVDYDALAKQHGGTVASSSGVDYDALAAQHGGSAPAAAPSSSWLQSAKDYLGEALQGVNPKAIAQGVNQAVTHPIDTAHAIGQQQGALEQKAEAAFKSGDYATGIRHAIDYLLPVIGPRLDQAGDYMQQGQYAKGLGATTDVGLQTVVPEAAARSLAATADAARLAKMSPADPAIRDAVAFGRAHNVPIDAATATDNPVVRAAQNLSDRSLGGAQVAQRVQQAQQQGLATVGEQLAAKAHPVPVTAEQAGDAVRAGVTGTVKTQGAAADTAYGTLRAIEAKTPIPVDLTSAKDVITPIYAKIAKGADIAPLQGSKAAAARAMARILEGPDVADASVVDSALSDLKAMQRDATGTPGAGPINQAVSQLHQAVTQAVTKAGPDALQALQDGRTATTAKYVAQDVLDGLHDEPVRTVNSLSPMRDTGIEKLRAVQAQAPQAIPQVGRAVLDGIMSDPTKGPDAQFAAWQKLGPQTKALLYQGQIAKDPTYLTDLDHFFTLQKKVAQNPNPSGSAYGVGALAQASQIVNPLHFAASVAGSAGLSAFLHSDLGVRLLTRGVTLPPSAAARAAWQSQVTNFIRAAQAARLATVPAGAGQPE